MAYERKKDTTLELYIVQALVDVDRFLPARPYASAGLCDSDVSVCPSVRLSVTRRYCA